ncbi:MAG: cupin domain-containing protein [Proteobacteria bacterium]|jgi:transcriptional regulator with XRE-family HTH domain|nr:cupin domain-containing protein [Pseudomonadota bacterium]
MDEKIITQKLKEIRLIKNLTLEKVAELSGLTKGYLSQIENSKNPPPIYTLSKISKALGVDITEFFSKTPESIQYQEMSITRNNEHLTMDKQGTAYGYIYEDLAPNKKGKNMEPLYVTVGFEQKADIHADFRHEGEEFLYVLEGKLEFFYKGKSHVLNEGDCVYFDADIPHSGRSIGDKKARLLIVIYSYKRL